MFRHEAGRITAVLTRIFGTHNINMAEDVVQEAFLQATQTWPYSNVPDNPAAWLMQVAKNKALDIIRRQQNFQQFSRELASQLQQETVHTLEQFFLDHEIADSQLRMIFACCHPALKAEDQVALTLKVVSGFSAAEIAKALVTHESTIQKRLYRAKQFLRNNHIPLDIPSGQELFSRLSMVHTVLYLLFNEGYNSSKADELIRKDCCVEAMRLALILSGHPAGRQPATFALLSLMCFQASRFESRMNADNDIIPLPDQDRTKWDKDLINQGYHFLNHSSQGDQFTVYHIESAIAAEHCLAPSFKETNWPRMLHLYDLLLQQNPSPVVNLNRALVIARLGQIDKAISEVWNIHGIEDLLASHYIYSAVLGDLYLRQGDQVKAKKYLEQACGLTNSIAEKNLIQKKLAEK